MVVDPKDAVVYVAHRDVALTSINKILGKCSIRHYNKTEMCNMCILILKKYSHENGYQLTAWLLTY